MCVRELNFRLLLRGLRADSMFAYRSKSSRVSVHLMRMLYLMGHYGSTGFVRSVLLASVIKMFVMASTPNSEWASRCANFGLFSTGSSPVRVLLYRYFHFI